MKKITFDEMLEQSDPRYGVPLANIDDIKNIQVPKSESKVIVTSDPTVANRLDDISEKLDKPTQPVVFPSSMRISNPSNFTKDATRIVEAINNKEIKVVMPKHKEEPKEEKGIDLLCYRVSDAAEPVTGDQYFGFINPDGGWYILHNEVDEGEVRYKFGIDNYKEAWDDYTNHEFKLLNEAINEIKD